MQRCRDLAVGPFLDHARLDGVPLAVWQRLDRLDYDALPFICEPLGPLEVAVIQFERLDREPPTYPILHATAPPAVGHNVVGNRDHPRRRRLRLRLVATCAPARARQFSVQVLASARASGGGSAQAEVSGNRQSSARIAASACGNGGGSAQVVTAFKVNAVTSAMENSAQP